MSYGITLNDAQDLLKRKLLINTMSIANLKAQIEYSKDSSILQIMTMKTAEKKIELVKKINEIIEQQLKEFTQERQDEFVQLYKKINELDTPTPKFRELLKRLEKNKEEMLTLMPKIQYLEEQMPNEQLITNFHIKMKTDSSVGNSCSGELL